MTFPFFFNFTIKLQRKQLLLFPSFKPQKQDFKDLKYI